MRGASVGRHCLHAGAALLLLCMLSVLAACVHLPPELARELEPPHPGAVDHYRPVAPAAAAGPGHDVAHHARP